MNMDYFDRLKIESIRADLKAQRRVQLGAGAVRAKLSDEVFQLERDLSRALLLLHAMCQVCLQKGVFTEDELQQMMHLLDANDGESDGLLDLNSTRPPDEREDTGPANTPAEHLRNIWNIQKVILENQ